MADTILGGIIINEILADPNGANNFDTDGNGRARGLDEFIELYNDSGSAIDISGVELWDQGRGNWFTFPPGTVLEAGAHAMVITKVQSGGSLPTGGPDDLFFDAGHGRGVMNNGRDNVVIYDPSNDQYIQALYNGDSLDDPTATYSGFSATATRSAGEDFGNDNDGFSIQRGPNGGDTFVNDQTPTPGTTNVCFTQGTLFDTPTGQTPVERLCPGDLLTTRDNGAQKIRWIWACTQSASAIQANPMLNAVRIDRGALGNGLPRRDLRVSRHHRILLTSIIAQRMFGSLEILVPAKDLIAFEGFDAAPVDGPVTYYHILLERHEILFAEGATVESLYLGKEALATIEPAAIDELRQIFGDTWATFAECAPKPACLMVTGQKFQTFVARHRKNHKAIIGAAAGSYL